MMEHNFADGIVTFIVFSRSHHVCLEWGLLGHEKKLPPPSVTRTKQARHSRHSQQMKSQLIQLNQLMKNCQRL